jgi:hypothetical protein
MMSQYNSVFGEDTQRGTDRLIRGVIQVHINMYYIHIVSVCMDLLVRLNLLDPCNARTVLLQDITELERENAVKPGKQRSEVKVRDQH